MKTLLRLLALFLFAATGLHSTSALAQSSKTLTPNKYNNLHWHFIGPGGAGGRISDIKSDPRNPDVVYVSGSTGGIFKTTDGCKSWKPIFDYAGTTLSVGDMAISPAAPNRIWVGTGEGNGEQSSASIGDGVYRSDDGGSSWKHLGLEKTQHIARIAAHPTNKDVLFVAATGARWGWNTERGLYRTQDAGETWEKVLYIDEKTGMSDVLVHPDGKTILASAYQQYRNAWAHLRSGKTSGLYRSEDGGDTWEKIELDQTVDPIGRIAIVYAPSNPEIMYACVESKSGGVYRSEDKGETWHLVNNQKKTSYWYGRIYVDPWDADHLFVMDVNVGESKNGGKTFNNMKARGVHVDHHILWWDPDNADHRLLGNDGGLYETFNDGKDWTFLSDLTFQQFYAFEVDQQDPYWIYGGLQDNGVWGFQVDTKEWSKITDDQLVRISGGDGFWAAIDPLNPEIVYGESQYGGLVQRDKRTNKQKYIKPRKPRGEEQYRFNWNAPYLISLHPPHAIYIGGNYLFKSVDQGDNWKEISPDLSKNEDLSKKKILGMKPALKPYASITALDESPLKPGLIYAGTDDGNLHMTRDDGANWTDLTDLLPMPDDRFMMRIICSSHDPATVYVAAARYYEANDFSPYLFRSTDYGQTWESLGANMPSAAIVKGFAEHPSNPDLLFAGVHNGLLISDNGGKTWEKVGGTLPPVCIDDIKVKMPENHLILGSYGRGIIIWEMNE